MKQKRGSIQSYGSISDVEGYEPILDGSDYDEDEDLNGNLTSWMNHESVALIGEPKCNKLKFFPATAIMVASMTGVGVLAFPNTFVNAGGCLEGIFFQLPFLFMAWVTLIAIGMVVKRHNVDEYEEMIISIFGDKVGQICRFFLFVYCMGNCIAYNLITIDQGRAFLQKAPYCAPLMTLILVPFIGAKNVAFLKYSGYVSIAAMVVLSFVVGLDYFMISDFEESPRAEIPDPDFSTMFSTFPIFCFAYQAHLSSVKIYRRIERPKMFPYISALALFICFCLYNLTGIFGLLTYGGKIDAEMLNSYPLDDIPIYFARLGIIGCVSGAYPVFTIMGRELLHKSDDTKYRYSFAVCWYIVTLVGAIYLPDFDLASKVIGSMAALLIFVFPGLALIVTYVERKLYRAILGTCFATLGVFLFFYSFLTAFY